MWGVYSVLFSIIQFQTSGVLEHIPPRIRGDLLLLEITSKGYHKSPLFSNMKYTDNSANLEAILNRHNRNLPSSFK